MELVGFVDGGMDVLACWVQGAGFMFLFMFTGLGKKGWLETTRGHKKIK